MKKTASRTPAALDEETLRLVKQKELTLLSSFIVCCERMNLTYYLLGGSMLGAVRHQGFIPWDDDIDVGMPRPDYEAFLANAQQHLPSCCFVQCRKTDPELPYNFAKLRDSSTTFIEKSVKNFRINHGVYIDIFPLDFYPDSLAAQKKFDRKNRLLTLRIREAFTIPAEDKHSPVIEAAASTVSKLLSLRYPSLQSALDAREALYRSVPKSTLVANYCGAWGKKETVPAGWYGKGAEAVFEGISVRIPAEYDKWLTQVYGDYMQLPPEEKRIPHHHVETVDTEKPYTCYF